MSTFARNKKITIETLQGVRISVQAKQYNLSEPLIKQIVDKVVKKANPDVYRLCLTDSENLSIRHARRMCQHLVPAIYNLQQ